MKQLLNFIKTTAIGGIFFMLPLSVLLIILGKVFNILSPIANYLSTKLPVHSFLTISLEYFIIILLLLFLCFILGLISKTSIAKKMVNWLEDRLLSNIPGYTFMKKTKEYVLGFKTEKEHAVLMVQEDESWSLAFEIEAVDDKYVIVFLPSAPSPWSGEIKIVLWANTQKVDMTYKDALSFIKKLGLGHGSFFKNQLSSVK